MQIENTIIGHKIHFKIEQMRQRIKIKKFNVYLKLSIYMLILNILYEISLVDIMLHNTFRQHKIKVNLKGHKILIISI